MSTKIYDFYYNLQYDPGAAVTRKYSNIPPNINAAKGLRTGNLIDLYLEDTIISELLKYSYGEISLERIDGLNNHIDFTRRPVPSGGGLYPNCLYILIPNENATGHDKYQYNPSLHSLTHLGFEESCDKDKIYIFITTYYWRNFFKYKEFSYRLMGIDTGYLLSMLSLNLGFYSLKHDIEVSSKMNRKIIDILNLNLSFEAPYAAVSFKLTPQSNSFVLDKDSSYRFESKPDKKEIPLNQFAEIEMNSLTNDFNFSVAQEKFGKLLNKKNIRKRVSPGGEFLLANKEMEYDSFYKFIHELIENLDINSCMSEDIKIYLFTNKVKDFSKNYFELKREGKKLEVIAERLSSEFFQECLTRRNFNLIEVPLLFHIGIDLKKYYQEYSYAGYKIAQIKVGYISNLLAQTAISNNFFTHPMMSYDSEKLELNIPIDNKVNIMNQIAVGYQVPLNRLQINI